MITKSTTLILGAGASYDYGYPLGKELKDDILKLSNCQNKDDRQIQRIKESGPLGQHNTLVIGAGDEMIRFLINNCDFEYQYIKQFNADFKFSPKYSIDTFLENRPEFLAIGKVLIAISIMQKESETILFKNSNSWYYHLFNSISSNWESINNNKLNIITYNYDRSLEYFLVKSLMATYGKTYQECIEMVDKIPIIHVHGTIGGHAFGIGVRPYNHNLTPHFIKEAASGLNIITEGIKKDVYDKVHEILSNSENKFILGFGFDERNMENLKLGQYSEYFYSTRMGLSDLQLLDINSKSGGKISFSGSEDYNIMQFFKYDATLTGETFGAAFKRGLRVLS